MAEYAMKELVRKQGLERCFEIASAATSTEEIGNPVYPPAVRELAKHGISCREKTARQLGKKDYAQYDLLIGMDHANIRNMNRMLGGDPEQKIHLLSDYTERQGSEISDPWYTHNFERTWQDIREGTEGLLRYLRKEKDLASEDI